MKTYRDLEVRCAIFRQHNSWQFRPNRRVRLQPRPSFYRKNFTMSTSYLNLDTKVRDIVKDFRCVNTLHPVISELCQSPELKEMFWASLNQDLHVICQRSQTLAHGEITAIQKAFAVLMENKHLIPAVGLYVDEILGLKFVSEIGRATTLTTMIQTRQSILGRTSIILHNLSTRHFADCHHHLKPTAAGRFDHLRLAIGICHQVVSRY